MCFLIVKKSEKEKYASFKLKQKFSPSHLKELIEKNISGNNNYPIECLIITLKIIFKMSNIYFCIIYIFFRKKNMNCNP